MKAHIPGRLSVPRFVLDVLDDVGHVPHNVGPLVRLTPLVQSVLISVVEVVYCILDENLLSKLGYWSWQHVLVLDDLLQRLGV